MKKIGLKLKNDMKIKLFSMVLFLSAPLFSVAAPICSVPVCDIPAKIAELRADTQTNRSNYYTYLNQTYKVSWDPNILANLIEFSLEAHQLSLSLDAGEEWIPNQVADLLNKSLVRALSQGPLQPATYGRWFGLFYGDSASSYRFSILLHWEQELKRLRLTTAGELRDLMAFMSLAASTSIQLSDEEYVTVLAKNISIQAGIQLLRLSPHMEGIFSVIATCDIVDQKLCPQMDRMSIVVGDDYRGIQTAFVLSGSETPVFEFSESKLKDERTLYGLTGPTDQVVPPGSFQIEFDIKTHAFHGVLITPRTRVQVKLTGKRIVSPQDLYELQSPVPLIQIDQIAGSYTGSALKVIFTNQPIDMFDFQVDRYSDTLFKATMRDHVSNNVLYDFPAMYYSPVLGVMTAFTMNQSGLMKITFVYRLQNGQPAWVGFAQSLRSAQYFYLSLDVK